MSTRLIKNAMALTLVALLFAGCSSNVTTSVATTETSAQKATNKVKAVTWGNSFEDALQKSRETGKLVMVDFYIDNCPPCHFLDTKTYVDPTVVRESEKFIRVKVKGTERTDLADKYRLEGYPTILWLDADGKMVHGVIGPYPAGLFIEQMRLAQSKAGKTAKIT